MSKIFVVGSLNMDIVVQVDRFPDSGETIIGNDYFYANGGKGANQAVSAAKLGANVYMVGAVGDDMYGSKLTENLIQNGVKTDYLSKLDFPTGTAFITLDKKGSNSIVVVPGANGKLTAETIDTMISHIQKDDIIVCQLEIPLETVKHVFKAAKEKGALTVLNPSPIINYDASLLSYVDLLVMNEIEAEKLYDGSTLEERAIGLIQNGIDYVVITLGEKGVIFCDKVLNCKRLPAYKVDVVDTTGAGDSFIGGIVAAWQDEKSFEEAVLYAIAVGSLSTTKYGAQPSLPSKEEVKTFIEAQKDN